LGLTEETLKKVEDYENSDLPDLHKTVLKLADKMAFNDISEKEEIYGILKGNFSHSEIIELTMAISTFIAFGRMNRFLEIEF
jgi:alkylhydroperoxidase family enzyme